MNRPATHAIRPHGSGGFTLVELMVALVTGLVLLSGIFQTLMTNQKIEATRGLQMQGRQTQLAAMDVLFAELREVSPSGGDLIAVGADSVQFRAQRKFGVTCAVNSTTGVLDVIQVGAALEVGDSVFVFADGDEETGSDDRWLLGGVTAVDSTITCLGSPAHRVDIPGIVSAMAVDSVRIGAPVRSFERYTYGLGQDSGDWYLMRSLDGGSATPLVGPLKSRNEGGLAFEYRDQFGAVTTTPTDVAQILVTVRDRRERVRLSAQPGAGFRRDGRQPQELGGRS